MAEAKKPDPIGRFIVVLVIFALLALIPDWKNFATLGRTSAPAVVRMQGAAK